MVVRLLILLLLSRALLATGSSTRRQSSSSLQTSPASFDIGDDQARINVRSIHIQNPSDRAVAAQLSLRHPSSRRLSKDGIVVLQGDLEEATFGPGRRLQAKAENCSHPLLLLRPRVSQSIRATRRLRRLAQLPGLENSTWLYLSHLGLSIAQLDCTADAEEVAKQLQSEHAGDLEFVEVDQRNLFKMEDVTDTHWNRQWGMRRSGFESAWSRLETYSFEPDPVTVAVLDTGVQLDHEDLQGRLWHNPGEIPGNGIDDDGNGYVDDVHGWDFADGDADPSDDDGHGTHCAGVISAVKNGKGIVGASGSSSSIRIMVLRFLSSQGGRTSDAILALNYAVSMGAVISSNSWGGASHSLALEAAVQSAREGGHLFIAAAGNMGSSNDFVPTFPCNYEAALCVAATTVTDELADYSNYGVNSVQIAAPGTDIMSTYLGNSYASLSGTSMATPHVAGAAALVWSWMGQRFVSDAAGDLREIILESAERPSFLNGWVSSGMLDVNGMVLKAESRNWLRLLQPPNGLVDATGTVASLQVDAHGEVTTNLEIGHPYLAVGTYQAEVVISEGVGEEVIPVTLIIHGSPYLPAGIFEGMLNFGMVPMGGEGRRTVRLWNYGNGTARVKLNPVASPFAGPLVEVSVEPHESMDLIVTCRPTSTGHFSGTANFGTNSGLPAYEASESDATEKGEQFSMDMSCEGSEAPHLELDSFSGAVLLQADGLPFHFTPCVPAQWEEDVLDPDSSEANVTAPLAVAESSNLEGCLPHQSTVAGHIVLVSRGGCTFQEKVTLIQDAGGLGGLFYDTEVTTTLRMMGTADATASPKLPAFMVSRSQGLTLRDRVLSGEVLLISLIRRPIVLHTHLPGEGSPRAYGKLGLQNLGGGLLHWNTEIDMLTFDEQSFYSIVYEGAANSTAGPDVAALPPAPVPSWTSSSTLTEDAHFRGKEIDDDASPLALAFPMPFYGQMVQDVEMSSNGLIAMAPDGTTYRKGSDYYGHLPSEALPNGLLAAYWDDLACSARSGCKLLTGQRAVGQNEAIASCGHSNATIIQYEDFAHRYDSSAVVSMEVRLYADGCMEVQYERFPGPSNRVAAKIGIETRSGRSGLNLAPVLPFGHERFGIMFVPFLAADPRRYTAEAVNAGATVDFHFHVEGYRSKQAWIMVRASDGTNHWNSERVVRVVQKVFSYSWKFSAWGPCTKMTCSSTVGEETRRVHCGGSDGGVYDSEHCAGPATCIDVAGWKDTWGDTCQTYAEKLYCTTAGGHGPGWMWWWGDFENYRKDGHIGPTACCACGGGVLADSRPESVRACSNPTQGPDWNGDGLDDCAPATIAPPAPVTETTTQTTATTTHTTETQTTQTVTSSTHTSSTSQTETKTTVTLTSSTDTKTSQTTSSTSTLTVSSTSATHTLTTTLTSSLTSLTTTATSTSATSSTTLTRTATSTATFSSTSTSLSKTSMTYSSVTTTETQTKTASSTFTSSSISQTDTVTTSTSTATMTSTSATNTGSSTKSATTTSSSISTSSTTTSSITETATATFTATMTTLTSTSITQSETATDTSTTSTSTISTSSTSTTTTSSSTATSSLTGTATTHTETTSRSETSTFTTSKTSTTVSTSISSTKTSSTTSTTISHTATTSATTTSSSSTSTSITSSYTSSSKTRTSSSTTSSSSTSTKTSTGSSTTTITSTSSTSTRSTSITSSTTVTISSTVSSSSSSTSSSSVTITETGTSTTTSTTTSRSTTFSSTVSSTMTETTTTSSSTTWSSTSSSTQSSTVTSTSSYSSSSTSLSSTSTSTSTSSTASVTSSSSSSSTSSSESSTSRTSSSSSSSSSTTSITVTQTETSSTTATSSTTSSSSSSSSSTSSSSSSSSSRSSTTTSVSSTYSSTSTLSSSSSSTTSTSSTSKTTSSSTSSMTTTTSSTSGSSTSSSLTETSTTSSTSSSSSSSSSSRTSSTSSVTTTTTSTTTTTTSTTSVSTTSGTTTASTSTSTTSSTSTATSTSKTITTSISSTRTSTSISSTISTSTSSSATSTSLTFTTSTSGTTTRSTSQSSTTTLSSTTSTTRSTTSGTITSTKTSSTSSTMSSTTSMTSSSSVTSSSTSITRSTSRTSTSMTTSSHTATSTISTTTTSSSVSETTSTSVTVTSTATSTVTSTSKTVSSTTSVTQTSTATSYTQTTSTQLRSGPPVQIMSQPEDVQTIESTLLVLGVNDTTPGLEESLQESISSTVGVDPRRVAIADLGMTMAAVLDEGVRRLQSIMELALEVNFQVILPSETSSESSEVSTSDTAASILSAVSAMKENPADLVSKLSTSLEVVTPLRARLTTPTLRQQQAVMVAEEWGVCGAGFACARAEQLMLRYRNVWCADAANISAKLSSALCSGNTPRTMEPCPATVTHPPSCGWHLGSWSECRSQVVEQNGTDGNGTDWADNTSIPCDSSGIGLQRRQVQCLAQDPATDCKAPTPNGQRECQCVGSWSPNLQQDQFASELVIEEATGLGPLFIFGIIAGGCMFCTCCTFCCFTILKGGAKGTKITKAEKNSVEFDGPAATGPSNVPPEVDRNAVTVCVASRRRGREDREDHEDREGQGKEWQESPNDGCDSTIAYSVRSPLSSPSHASPSYQSRIAPLGSPCSIASVQSQPVQLPLPSPSAMSVSSINAILQSPAHSMQGSVSEMTLADGFGELQSPSHGRLGPLSPKRRAGGPSLPALSEHHHGETEQTTLFAALSSPSNFLRPASPSKRRAPQLPSVAEIERHTELDQLPVQPQNLQSVEEKSPVISGRKKKGHRPPTLELDRYLVEEEAPVPVPPDEADIEMNYATSPSKSPSKRNASRSFAPAWIREESETSGMSCGTPSHSERFDLKSVPPQPLLPLPPTPGGTQPPLPIPKNPEPPSQPPQGLRRGNSKVNFPTVPPSPSAKSDAPIAKELSDLAIPAAPSLPPPPPRLESRESDGKSVVSL